MRDLSSCPHAWWNPNGSTVIHLNSIVVNFAIDSDHRIYVAHPKKNPIDIYSSSGVHLTDITSHITRYLHGIALCIPAGRSMAITSIWRKFFWGPINVWGAWKLLGTVCRSQWNFVLFSIRRLSSALFHDRGRLSLIGKTVHQDCGTATTEPCFPKGMHGDDNFDLCVADARNNRIQRFRSRSTNGETLLGGRKSIVVSLKSPLGVTMDPHGTLFVADYGNYRIIQYFESHWRGIAGCPDGSGQSSSNEWLSPADLEFDGQGTLLVANMVGETSWAIEKHVLEGNTCCECNASAAFERLRRFFSP